VASEEFGSYIVYEQLGVGGMASVHVAESRSAGGFRKRVALKRLLAHAAAQPELVEAFTHEARLARYLHHANIAQTFDFGQVDDTFFIAMELAAGPTLGQLIRQCKSTIGVIPFPITLNILIQICDALEYAHNCVDETGAPLGIIHRDVSPPNVVISNAGIVKLIDFGLAKAKTSLVQTQVGTVKGKFRYMAPEYLSGKLDRRVDLWAIGVVAHELLTTHQLFDGESDLGVLDKVRSMAIEPPSRKNPDVPPELDAIVMTALERDPDKRWQSAGAMKTALADVAEELQTVVTNAQLVQWVEWAFTQEPPDDRSELSQLITLLEQPSRPSEKSLAKKRDTPAAPRKPRMFSTPRVGASIAKRKQGASRALWLLLLLAIVGGAAYAAWFYGYIELPGL
jgi:eukaryotic-like serine/threonine-protein kinase